METMPYYDKLAFASETGFMMDAPCFERTDSILRGFVLKIKDELTMNDLGKVLQICKKNIPEWDIEFAPKRNSIFQWVNEKGDKCVIQSFIHQSYVDLPFIVDNKPAHMYEQNNLLSINNQKMSVFIKDDVDQEEAEKVIILSKAFDELGFETVDWIYLN